MRPVLLKPASDNQRQTCPIRASAGLLVEADHVSSRIAEPCRNLGRIRADRLHDLTPLRYHGIKGRRHAVHHDVKEEPRLCRGWAPQHPRAAHFVDRVVKRSAAIATLAALPAEDLLVEVSRPRNVRRGHLDVTDLSILERGSHHHSFQCAAISMGCPNVTQNPLMSRVMSSRMP